MLETSDSGKFVSLRISYAISASNFIAYTKHVRTNHNVFNILKSIYYWFTFVQCIVDLRLLHCIFSAYIFAKCLEVHVT